MHFLKTVFINKYIIVVKHSNTTDKIKFLCGQVLPKEMALCIPFYGDDQCCQINVS